MTKKKPAELVASEPMQRLVDEMTKARPDTKLVKKLLSEAGLEVKDDPMDQFNVLLKALHTESVKL